MAQDGLVQPWRGIVFLNPPYPDTAAAWNADRAALRVPPRAAKKVRALVAEVLTGVILRADRCGIAADALDRLANALRNDPALSTAAQELHR